jgi:hypothetical protein
MPSRGFLPCAALAVMIVASAGAADAQQLLLVSPVLPTSADEIRIEVATPLPCFTQSTAIDANQIILSTDSSNNCGPASPLSYPSFFIADFLLQPLPPGSYTVVVFTNGQMTDSRPLLIQTASSTLSLLDRRFTVSVMWTNPVSRASATAAAVQVSDASGYFSFFSPEDIELTVKMIVGGPVNGNFWFFLSSGTNLAFSITVIDTRTGTTHTYLNRAGLNQNILDFASFPDVSHP